MPLTQFKRLKNGLRKTSGLVANVAATTPLTLYILSPGRTATVRKIHIFNGQGAPVTVQIGQGLGGLFVQTLGTFYAINAIDLEVIEEEIPGVEFSANITMQVSAAGAGAAAVTVQVEVEEYQGPTG
jgi:hypothetical protein